jgi:hypothetical protein
MLVLLKSDPESGKRRIGGEEEEKATHKERNNLLI